MEKSYDKTTKKFTSRMQANLLLVFCVVSLLLVGLMGRLIYIMQTDGDRYAKQVLSRESYVSSVLPYKRGSIMDRNGTVLAQSELRYRLIIDAKLLLLNEENITPTINAIQKVFGVDSGQLQDLLQENPDRHYVTVLKDLKYDVVQSFDEEKSKDKDIIGVWFDQEYVRTYPYDTLACDILGFTSADNTGYWGIEEYYNEVLNGTNGREYGYYNSELDIERIVKKAVNGNNVVSTIDANVQRIIQKHIIDFNTEFGSKNIGILIMNPNNGDILGMASNQEYNLNTPRSLEGIYTQSEIDSMTEEQKMEALNKLWRNYAISDGFEPGSTFKPVTIAAGLEENLVTNNSTFICDGSEMVPGYPEPIKCSNRSGHGELNLEEALMHSCNDALMKIVASEGKEIFYNYEVGLGFGKKTNIDLPGEAAGLIVEKDRLSAADMAASSFGQTINTTMVQMAAAFSSLVNGGYYYQPHVMKRIVNDNGAVVKDFDKLLIRQTVSEETSEFIQEAMYRTVEEGTAKYAKVDGYSIGGKTGTAQKYPREAKTYLVSFLGCAPAINPEVVIYVIVDEPQNVEKQADSSIATKFASRIMNEVLPALGIYPDGDIDYLLDSEDEDSSDTADQTGTDTQNDNATQDNNDTGENTEQDENTQDNSGDNSSTEDTQDNNNAENTEDDTGDSSQEEDTSDEQENEPGTEEDTDTPEQSTEDNSTENDNETTETSEDDEFNPDAL